MQAPHVHSRFAFLPLYCFQVSLECSQSGVDYLSFVPRRFLPLARAFERAF